MKARASKRIALIVAATLALVVGMPTSPAAADPASYGWYDNHQICKFSTGCVRSGNLVALWQTILWADGLASSSDIDGQFGPNTHNWTVLWQSRHMEGDLSGKVGPKTWTTAYDLLRRNSYCSVDNYSYARYAGSHEIFLLRLDCANGNWWFGKPPTGAWTDTNH
jgi:hypothetical protein